MCILMELSLRGIVVQGYRWGQVDRSQANSMLCTMLWQGLRPQLKDVTAYIADRITDFDELRVAFRRVEQDQSQRDTEKPKKPVVTSKSAVDTALVEGGGGLDEIRGIVKQLAADMKTLTEGKFHGKDKGSQQKDRRPKQHASQATKQDFAPYQNPRQQSTAPGGFGDPQFQGNFSYTSPAPPEDVTEEPTCYRCGQVGHIAVGCRVKLENRTRQSNFQRPSSRGRR